MKRRQPSGGGSQRSPRPERSRRQQGPAAQSRSEPGSRSRSRQDGPARPPREPRGEPRQEARRPPRSEARQPAQSEPRRPPRSEARQQAQSEPRRQPRSEPRRPPQSEPRRPPQSEPRRQPRQEPRRSPRPQPGAATAATTPAAPAADPRRRDDVIYGRNAVLEAVRAGRARRVLISAGAEPDPRLAELRRTGLVEEVPAARVASLAQGAHQGVVAELRPREFLTLRQLLELRPSLLLALDGIEDPQNLGAILRTAEAAGVDGVLLPERRSAPLTAAAVKASSGASEHLRLCRVPGLPSAIAEIRRHEIWCVALDSRGESPPWEFDLAQPVCLVVGGEGRGVHRLVRERCDVRLRLPMAGRVASLNASAAAAMLFYEVTRQRARPAPR